MDLMFYSELSFFFTVCLNGVVLESSRELWDDPSHGGRWRGSRGRRENGSTDRFPWRSPTLCVNRVWIGGNLMERGRKESWPGHHGAPEGRKSTLHNHGFGASGFWGLNSKDTAEGHAWAEWQSAALLSSLCHTHGRECCQRHLWCDVPSSKQTYRVDA
jgi:hypothetical protein